MQVLQKSILVLALCVLCCGKLFAQGGLDVDQTSGSLYYEYPISEQSINGVLIGSSLVYNSNVSQFMLARYATGVPETAPYGTYTEDTLYTYKRSAGVWMLNVGGFCVQTFATAPWGQIAKSNHQTGDWFTDGYDACNRMNNGIDDGDQDQIRLLRGDGSILDLRNPYLVSTAPTTALAYTGRYYENAVNANGFAIVEFDDTYFPDVIKNQFLEVGQTTVHDKYRARIVRYFPGDGLEYIFREIVLPYGPVQGHNAVYMAHTSEDELYRRRRAGTTIFYLEEIKRDHSTLVTFKRNKHYPTESKPDMSFGRASLASYTGHQLYFGEGIVTLVSLGRTHKFTLRNQGHYLGSSDEKTFENEDYNPALWSGNFIYNDQKRFGDLLTFDDNMVSYDYATNNHIREIISPTNQRFQFSYTFRDGTGSQLHCATISNRNAILSSVKDHKGKTDIDYYEHFGSFIQNQSPSAAGTAGSIIHPEHSNVVSELKTYNASTTIPTLLAKVTFEYINGPVSLNSVNYYRKTVLTTTDETVGTIKEPYQTTVTKYYLQEMVTPYVVNSASSAVDQELPYLYCAVNTIRKGDVSTREFITQTSPSNLSRFRYIPSFIETYIQDGPVTSTWTAVSQVDRSIPLAAVETLTDAFPGNTALSNLMRVFPTKIVTEHFSPTGTLPVTWTSNGRTETIVKNFPYATTSCFIKDSTVLEQKTERGVDSLRNASTVITNNGSYYRVYETPATPQEVTVRLGPIIGSTISTQQFDKNGVFITGVRIDRNENYLCAESSSGVLPTFIRGTVKEVHRNIPSGGTAGTTTLKIQELEYTHGNYRNILRKTTDVFGASSELKYHWNAPLVTGAEPIIGKLIENQKSSGLYQSRNYTLADNAYWNESPTSSIIKPRRFAHTTDVSISLRNYDVRSIDGLTTYSVNPNGTLSAGRKDADSNQLYSWRAFDYPSEWRDREDFVKLWKSHTKESITTRSGNCVSSWNTSSTDRYRADRLYIASDITNQRMFCASSGDYISPTEKNTSILEMKYVATPNDIVHTESNISTIKLRLDVASITGYGGEVDIKATFSGGGLTSPYSTTLTLINLSEEDELSNGREVGIIEIPTSSDVVDKMLAMSSGQEMSIVLEIENTTTTDEPLVEFVSRGTSSMPRLIALSDHDESPTTPLIESDVTTNDYSSQSLSNFSGNKSVVRTKVDDNNTRIVPATLTSDNTVESRRMGTAYGYDNIGLEKRSGYFLADQVGITPVDTNWTKATVSALGSIKQVINFLGNTVDVKSWSYAVNQVELAPVGTSTLRPKLESYDTIFIAAPLEEPFTSGRLDWNNFKGLCVYSRTQDGEGRKVSKYFNVLGQLMATVQDTGLNCLVTKYTYDDAGRLASIIMPKNDPLIIHTITYAYDEFNRVKQVTHPDFGITRVRFNDRNELRFVQNGQQIQNNTFTYFEYDDIGRLTLVGEAKCSVGVHSTSLNPNKINLYPGSPSTERTFNRTVFQPLVAAQKPFGFLHLVEAGSIGESPIFCPLITLKRYQIPYERIPGAMLTGQGFLGRAVIVPFLDATHQTQSSTTNFEHVVTNPQNVRKHILYDEIPFGPNPNVQLEGFVWSNLPSKAKLECLLPPPYNAIRNTKGRVAAIAYREHGGANAVSGAIENFWYKVYSYDERGRVETIIQINDYSARTVITYQYDNADRLTLTRVITPVDNHATWYSYNNVGQVEKIWSSYVGRDQTGVNPKGFTPLTVPAPGLEAVTHCYSDVHLATRNEQHDVQFEYDLAGRITTRTQFNADPSGNKIITTYDRGENGELIKQTSALYSPANIWQSDLFEDEVVSRDLSFKITERTTTLLGTNVIDREYQYDTKGRLIQDNATVTPPQTVDYVLDAHTNRTERNGVGVAVNEDIYKNFGAVARSAPDVVDMFPLQLGRTNMLGAGTGYDFAGRLQTRELELQAVPTNLVCNEAFYWGTNDRLVQMATNYNVLSAPPEGCSPPPAPTPSQNISSQYASPSVITQRDHWTYRYSPGGERELKRLMIAALYPDAASCGAVPWVGTLQGVGDVPVAIFHGRQTQSPEGCNHTAYNSVVDQNRRVMLYSYEFRSYGPDGIALLFQRNNATGVMEKRFPIQDYQGSIVAVTGPGMTVPISTAYTTFGTPTPDGKERSTATSTWIEQSRTAFMDKCIDWETAPFTGMEEYQLYDVSARKYQAATGTFITPDPLWVVSPGSGSYTYANHDPINLIDPSGLAPEGSGQPRTEDGTEVVAGRPTITKTEPDPGTVKEPENKDGIVTGSGEPGNAPAPAPTNKPIGKQSQEFLDNYAAVNAIHAEWDADHKGIGAEQGNPGDGNSGGQRYGEEKGLPKRDETNTTPYTGSPERTGKYERPDADGYLTLEEAMHWYNVGSGHPLTVQLSKLDLSDIYSDDFDGTGKEHKKAFNLLLLSSSKGEASVYGNLTFVLYPNNIVHVYADDYDFEMHSWWNPLNWIRNLETIFGEWMHSEGKKYKIYIDGEAKIKPNRPHLFVK